MQCLLKGLWNPKKIAVFAHLNDTMGMNYFIIHGLKNNSGTFKKIRAIAFIWVFKSSINGICFWEDAKKYF